jgi:hypothetical protein
VILVKTLLTNKKMVLPRVRRVFSMTPFLELLGRYFDKAPLVHSKGSDSFCMVFSEKPVKGNTRAF